MEVGRHGAGNTGWGAKRWSHRECVSDIRKNRGRSKREKEETEGERRIAERKRMREKHDEKAIEDTARKGGRRRTSCYEGKAKEIKVREEESGGVEDEESGKALRRIFKPREEERAKT